MDQWLAPSFSMIGWSVFVGPAVRSKDPEELVQTKKNAAMTAVRANEDNALGVE